MSRNISRDDRDGAYLQGISNGYLAITITAKLSEQIDATYKDAEDRQRDS